MNFAFPCSRALAPKVVESAKILEVEKRCKVLFVSNDRDTEAFQTSVSKKTGIDVMPYNLERTKAMRDVFKLTTIPALMILKNDNLDRAAPTVITNARHAIEADPKAQNFPWASIHSSSSVNEVGPNSGAAKAETMSLMDRLIIRGKYGKWWELGHHANPNKPQDMFMDEHAVRIRAGLLNIITWIALINIFFWRKPIFVKVLYPLVGFEFISSALIGLTPVAPLGTLATFIAFVLHPEPFWKPAKPKRFAWLIGLSLATACLVLFTFRKDMDWEDYRPAIGFVVAFCNLATWLEGNAGFCLGCFIYNSFLVPMMHLDECSECKL